MKDKFINRKDFENELRKEYSRLVAESHYNREEPKYEWQLEELDKVLQILKAIPAIAQECVEDPNPVLPNNNREKRNFFSQEEVDKVFGSMSKQQKKEYSNFLFAQKIRKADYGLKYPIGMMVKIRPDLKVGSQYGKYKATEEMVEFAGMDACVVAQKVINDISAYLLDIDNSFWLWTEEMFV